LSNIALQLKDCIDLVSRGKFKLQVLKCEAQNLENQFARLKTEPEPQNSKEINLVDNILKAIHWKCHVQLNILEKFRKMFESSKVEHKVVVEMASKNVIDKYENYYSCLTSAVNGPEWDTYSKPLSLSSSF
jgi:hypothetical protein